MMSFFWGVIYLQNPIHLYEFLGFPNGAHLPFCFKGACWTRCNSWSWGWCSQWIASAISGEKIWLKGTGARRRRYEFHLVPFLVGWNNSLNRNQESSKNNWVVVSNIFYFSPLFGGMIQFDLYFSDGLKPPTTSSLVKRHRRRGYMI